MKHVPFLAIAAVLLTASCMSAKKPVATTGGLEGTRWVLTELMGKPITPASDPKNQLFIELDPATKRMSGYTGCNNAMGGYTADVANGRIKFEKTAVTQKACMDANHEGDFLKMLEAVDNFAIADGVLSLAKARMAPMARFKAITKDPR